MIVEKGPVSSQLITRVSPEEYLEFERSAEARHEWIDGKIVAVPDRSLRHSLITANLGGELGTRLLGRCLVFSSNARVCVDWQRLITYPNVSVLCGRPEYVDAHRDMYTNPKLIAEVFDRGQKRWLYGQLPSLSECLLVSEEPVFIEHYSRRPDGDWSIETVRDLDAVIKLESLGCELPVNLIYQGVDVLGRS